MIDKGGARNGEGDLEWGTLLAGQICGMIKDIKPVKAIIDDIVAGAEAVISQLCCNRGG